MKTSIQKIVRKLARRILGREWLGSLTVVAASMLAGDALAQGRNDFQPLPPVDPAAYESTERLFTTEEVRAIVREELTLQHNAPAGDEGYVVGSDLNMPGKWNHGWEATSPGKDFRVHVGGRTQFDASWFDVNDEFQTTRNVPFNDAVNFRRARIRIDGVMYEVIEYACEYDFVNEVNDDPLLPVNNNTAINIPAPTDLWLTIRHLPVVGNLRIGNMKPQIGMEHLTSSRFLPFMERSFMQDAFFGPFNNGFAPGFMLFNWGEQERMTWAIGGFKNVSNIFGSGWGDGEYDVTGRVTVLPWYACDGRSLLHLGVAGSHRGLDDGAVRIRSRASIRNGNPGPLNPVIADTGFFGGQGQSLIGGELAGVAGSWTFQSEYFASTVDDAVSGGVDRGNPVFHGYYAQVFYFLTGEHQAYNRRTGVFDRVVPHENFFLVKSDCGPLYGRGAWQIGARYSRLDLTDEGINGGIIQDMTVGLNWFLNPNLKFQFNYVYTDRDGVGTATDGHFHAFGTRMAFDF